MPKYALSNNVPTRRAAFGSFPFSKYVPINAAGTAGLSAAAKTFQSGKILLDKTGIVPYNTEVPLDD